MQPGLNETRFDEVIIELSYNCNLSCIMCGFGKDANPYDKSKFMSLDRYKVILDQVGARTKTIRLNGRGESTIHPDFQRILAHTKELHPDVSINLFSNMSFKNQAIIDAMLDNNVQLFISLDSPMATELAAIRKGAKFHYIEHNIKQLDASPTRPFIIFTIQEANLHRLFDIAEFAFNNNCHILFNTIRRDSGIETFIEAVEKNYQSVLSQLKEANALYAESILQCLVPDQLAGVELKGLSRPIQTHGSMSVCTALDRELCVLYDGTVTPCNMFNPYVYGNIIKQPLEKIWSGKKRMKFLESHKTHYYCQYCANLSV